MPASEAETLIAAIYDAAVDSELWPEVLARIATALDCRAVFYAHVPADRMWLGTAWAHGIEDGHIAAFMTPEVVARSAYARACLMAEVGSALTLYVPARDGFDGDPAVRALLGPERLTHALYGPALRQDGMLCPFAAINDSGSGPLGARGVRLYAALQPHLRRASLIQFRLDRLLDRAEALSDALHRLAHGVVSVSTDLRVRFANAEAERIFGLCDGMTICHGRLALAQPAAEAALRAALVRRPVLGSDEPAAIAVSRPSGASDFTIVVSPSRVGLGGGARDRTTLFVTDPAGPATVPDADRLAQRFGFTAAEAEVARLAAIGLAMPAAAAALGVSVNTVRTHLKAVYGKTDVHSRPALARLLETSFPPIRSERPAVRRPAGRAR